MACGTPVIAWRRGSVAEIIEDGVTGFLVDALGATRPEVPSIQSAAVMFAALSRNSARIPSVCP